MKIQRLLNSSLFRFIVFAIASCSLIVLLTNQPVFSKNDESVFSDKDVDFSFVVVGCNRVDKADIAKTSPSTANIEQLKRTFKACSYTHLTLPTNREVYSTGYAVQIKKQNDDEVDDKR